MSGGALAMKHGGAFWRAWQAFAGPGDTARLRRRGLVGVAFCVAMGLWVYVIRPNPTMQQQIDLRAAVKELNAVQGTPNRSMGDAIQEAARQELAMREQQQRTQQEQLKEKALTDDQWAAAQRAAIQRKEAQAANARQQGIEHFKEMLQDPANVRPGRSGGGLAILSPRGS